ncbi:hypothetical protein ECANGB1_2082 [Enterospora canceri]|uniref:Uncharacterized protein n=1 Tax=Enterospora canceri TaxID=1081671 RepID=A0A1Y1S8R9_9MICR|nr:hypothetical protein ECANGB1_2082 [Enterospora canceri]
MNLILVILGALCSLIRGSANTIESLLLKEEILLERNKILIREVEVSKMNEKLPVAELKVVFNNARAAEFDLNKLTVNKLELEVMEPILNNMVNCCMMLTERNNTTKDSNFSITIIDSKLREKVTRSLKTLNMIPVFITTQDCKVACQVALLRVKYQLKQLEPKLRELNEVKKEKDRLLSQKKSELKALKKNTILLKKKVHNCTTGIKRVQTKIKQKKEV